MLYVDITKPYPELGNNHPEARWINAFGEWKVNEKEFWKP